MGELFHFMISFFSRWTRIAGLLSLVLAVGYLTLWINLLYIPHGMKDIDQSVICFAIVLITVCSLVFFLMEPESCEDSVNDEVRS